MRVCCSSFASTPLVSVSKHTEHTPPCRFFTSISPQAFVTMSLAGNKRLAASPAEVEDDTSRPVRPGNAEKTGPGSSSAFTVKRLTIPTEASPGQMLLESPLLLPGLLVCSRHSTSMSLGLLSLPYPIPSQNLRVQLQFFFPTLYSWHFKKQNKKNWWAACIL